MSARQAHQTPETNLSFSISGFILVGDKLGLYHSYLLFTRLEGTNKKNLVSQRVTDGDRVGIGLGWGGC